MQWKKIIGLMVLTLVLIPSFSIALADDMLTVSTKDSYELGDDVSVKGYSSINETITVVISKDTEDILTLTDDPNKKGNYTVEFTLDDNFEAGQFEVNATVDELWVTATFIVALESEEEEEPEEEVIVESEEVEEDGAPCEEMTEEELYAAIDRALLFIDRVNATANSIEDEYNMTYFYEFVNELHSGLTDLKDKSFEKAREEFCELRKDVSNLNGLLSSVTKNVKEKKALRFMEQMERLIGSTMEKIEGISGAEESEGLRAALEAHQRKLERLRLTSNTMDLDDLIDDAEEVVEELNGDLEWFDSDGFSLKEMFKVQAKIQVLNATVERMEEKDKDMGRLRKMLENAEALMGTIDDQGWAKNWGKMKDTLESAEVELSGVGKAIRKLNEPNKPDEGGNGKGNGH
jgi:hypothetical protein